MFGWLKKDAKVKDKGEFMAMEGLEAAKVAFESNLAEFQQMSMSPDVRVCVDHPLGDPRISFIMIDDDGQVMGRCCYVFDGLSRDGIKWQIDWSVFEEFRGNGIATQLVELSINWVKMWSETQQSGCKTTLEAVVSPNNEASNKLAEKFIGGLEVLQCGETMQYTNSYLSEV